MKMKRGETSSRDNYKTERKTIEKNRRIQMKSLCHKLVSLIPDHHFYPPKEFLSQQDQLEQTAGYIKHLTGRIGELKSRKTQIITLTNTNATNNGIDGAATQDGSMLPILRIRDSDSSLEVFLISGITKSFMLHQIISIIEEEGGEVETVSLSNVGDKIFHTLHAKVKVPRVGMDTQRVCERIQDLIS